MNSVYNSDSSVLHSLLMAKLTPLRPAALKPISFFQKQGRIQKFMNSYYIHMEFSIAQKQKNVKKNVTWIWTSFKKGNSNRSEKFIEASPPHPCWKISLVEKTPGWLVNSADCDKDYVCKTRVRGRESVPIQPFCYPAHAAIKTKVIKIKWICSPFQEVTGESVHLGKLWDWRQKQPKVTKYVI